MYQITLQKFSQIAYSGGIQGGDIIFRATPNHTVDFTLNMIKVGQFLRANCHDKDSDGINHTKFTHVGIVTQQYTPRGIKTKIAESRPPESCETDLHVFLTRERNPELVVFRTKNPAFRAALNYYAIQYANEHIAYARPAQQILSLLPKKTTHPPMRIPSSINCSSFALFVHNVACYYGNFFTYTAPLPYSDISPCDLYHKFKDKEEYEKTWDRMYHVIQ